MDRGKGGEVVMSNANTSKGKLTAQEREYIQAGIANGYRIGTIAKALGRSPSTIAREIQRNYTSISSDYMGGSAKRNICIHKGNCRHIDLCNKGCLVPCVRCHYALCNDICPDFEADECKRLTLPPYCCNVCTQRFSATGCSHPYHFYNAAVAHEMAQRRKSKSRAGIDCTPEELEKTVQIAKEGLKKGQSIRHIWATHPDEVCCSWRTFYDYIENGITDIINHDLPMKVRYCQRKRKAETGIMRADLAGRTYEDFSKLSETKKMTTVEMDCVVGRSGTDKQALLTLLWRRANYQIMILLTEHTSDQVVLALDMIQSLCGDEFEKVIPVLLADRGSEFSNTYRIKHGPYGKKRCDVYYCDPQQSEQKPFCETNHRLIRKVLPKGKSNFNALTPRNVALLSSYVNSYAREALGWATPYGLAKAMLPDDLIDGLGVEKINPEEVELKPQLLPHVIVEKKKRL